MRQLLLISTLLVLVFVGLPAQAIAHTLKYKVYRDGKEIGYIRAVRSTQGEQVVYDVETHMTIKVLINQKVDYTSNAVYTNGILQSSSARSWVNDKVHHSCYTTLKGNKYIVKTDKDNLVINRLISYSGVLLYFREPGNVDRVFSEMSGQDNLMRKAGAGYYILTNSKSKKQNKYWYKGGMLDRAFINHTLIDIEIQRVN
jgi:hypothetical protein